ncbi:hypothetical protein Tco_0614708 [Tanacetum coccineum]
MDHGSRNGLPANEKVDSRIAYDGRAIRERRINHLLGIIKRGHHFRPDDGERREANTHLFRQPSTVSHCNHKSANKADVIKLEVTGRLLKWSFELKEHDIQYRPRTSVKGAEELPDPRTLFTDGSSCTDGSGAGLILTNP